MLKIKNKNYLLEAALKRIKNSSFNKVKPKTISTFSSEQQRKIEQAQRNKKRINQWINKSCDLFINSKTV